VAGRKIRPASEALAALVSGADLKLVDVGARGEPRPELLVLAPFAELYAFEPDPDEAARLQTEESSSWRRVTVIPCAVAAEEGTATLHQTSAAGMTSLLEPDPAVYGRYARPEAFKVVGTSVVETLPLDLAAGRYGFEEACFLKLDTQGTELEILKSGERLLDHLVGIYTEALFQPFYKEQSLFADTDSYLRERGFVLVDLRVTALRGAGHPEELYSARQVTWAHCLYLREPAKLADRKMRVRELAIALAYEQNDFAADVASAETSLADLVRKHIEEDTRRLMEGMSSKQRTRLLRDKVKK
jgi:FkbM family methyltransferase